MTDPWAAPGPAAPTSWPLAPFARATGPRVLRAQLLAGLVVAAATVLLAAPVGLLWTAVSPRVSIVVSGVEAFAFVDSEPEGYVGADAVFTLLTATVGVVVGYLCWRWARRFGPAVAVALAAAGLAASFTAMTVGERYEQPRRAAAVAAVTEGVTGVRELGLSVRAQEATVAWPLGALVGFLLPLAYRRD